MRLVLTFLALAALVLVPWMIWGGEWEKGFSLAGSIRWLENTGRWAWAAGMLLLVGDLILPIPGTVVMSALGYLYGGLLGGIAAATGSVLAGIAGYGIGRFFPESIAERWLGERDFCKGRRLFANCGGWIVALSRALPILPEVVSCTAGLVRMPFGRFTAALACGSVPMGFVFAMIGATGHDRPGLALTLSLVLPALLWLLARRFAPRASGGA